MANWYFVNAKTRDKSGPHEESFVRAKFIAGEIRPETPVWHDGLAHWIPASQAFSALQAPGGIEGRVPRPDGLLGWMTFVGVMTILVAIPPSLMLYGLPLLFAGIAALSARAALRTISAPCHSAPRRKPLVMPGANSLLPPMGQ